MRVRARARVCGSTSGRFTPHFVKTIAAALKAESSTAEKVQISFCSPTAAALVRYEHADAAGVREDGEMTPGPPTQLTADGRKVGVRPRKRSVRVSHVADSGRVNLDLFVLRLCGSSVWRLSLRSR